MPLEFAGYAPDWPEMARQAIAELMAALPGLFTRTTRPGTAL